MLHSVPVLELRTMPQGVVQGIASSFSRVDSYGHKVAPGAYRDTLAEHAKAGTAPAMLWSHAQDSPVGRWEKLEETSQGLFAGGRLNLKTAAGREAFEHLSAGDISGLSVGFRVLPGGDEMDGDIRILKRIQLFEVSLVAIPADAGARITSIKAAGAEKPETVREFQSALQELGFSRREAARIAEKGFAGSEPDDEPINSKELLAVKSALQSLALSMKV